MEVILLDRIPKLGGLGEKVKVKAGYGRNYLLPQGKAIPANPQNIAKFEEQRAELEKEAKVRFDAAKQRAANLEALSLSISMNVSDDGKLYGSVGTAEIIDLITTAGQQAEKKEVLLPYGPIRELGDHEVQLSLHHGEVIATVKISVVAQESSS